MKAMLAAERSPPVHVDPEQLARHVDGREIPEQVLGHIAACELCRARAADARLLRALLAGKPDADAASSIPLDASTLAGYHDQALPGEQMAAVDRRLLRDDAALLELIELRLGLNAGVRAAPADAQLVARTAAAFSTVQSEQSVHIASLGTLIIDRESQIPVFHHHSATPEGIAADGATVRSIAGGGAHLNDSGSYPAPAARRELTLHAGRHTLRVRMAAGNRIELFVFDEQHFRPANGIQVRLEPDEGEVFSRTTGQAGFAAFELTPGHARLLIDAGDRWLLELR